MFKKRLSILIILVLLFNTSTIAFASNNVVEFDQDGIHYKVTEITDNENYRIVQTETSEGFVTRAILDKKTNTLKSFKLKNANTMKSKSVSKYKNKVDETLGNFDEVFEINMNEIQNQSNKIESELSKNLVSTRGIFSHDYYEGPIFYNWSWEREINDTTYTYTLNTNKEYLNTPGLDYGNYTERRIITNTTDFKNNLEKANDYGMEAASNLVGATPGVGQAISVGSIIMTAYEQWPLSLNEIGAIAINALITFFKNIGAAAAISSYISLTLASLHNANQEFTNVVNGVNAI